MAVSSETVALLLGAERNPFARSLRGSVRAVRSIGSRPLGAFGMPRRCLVLGESVGVNQDDGQGNCKL